MSQRARRCSRRSRSRDLQQQRRFVGRTDAFGLPDDRFILLYRLPKPLVMDLCNKLRGRLSPFSSSSTAIPAEIKVLCSLRFYATGGYQRSIGQERHIGLDQSSVHKGSVRGHQRGSSAANGFPHVIGAIDGTHVRILAPSSTTDPQREVAYVNRKGYHSINVQLVCDAQLIFTNVNALFPGSCHDAHIWRQSELHNILEREYSVHGPYWLLGDSGYPQQDYLMTPFVHPRGAAEQAYNTSHKRTRSIIERAIGVLKTRFRCLHGDNVLNYSPYRSGLIINACVCLHNMCRRHNISLSREEEASGNDSSSADDDTTDGGAGSSTYQNATTSRNRVVAAHFSRH